MQVYYYPAGFGMVSVSPFCCKLDLYLKSTNVDYEIQYSNFKGKAPRGTKPHVVSVEGTRLGDTTQIIRHLVERGGIDLDVDLDQQQKALTHGLKCLVENHLFYLGMHYRFRTKEGDKSMQQSAYVTLKGPAKSAAKIYKKKATDKRLRGVGMQHWTDAELEIAFKEDLRTISTWLGSNTYFHGDSLTTADCILWGVMSQLYFDPAFADLGFVKWMESDVPNLVRYAQMIRAKFYPESA